MASSNNDMNKTNDYLTWDAENFKALITRKLSTNPLFTDQIFQDSNLSTLIDVFSYMYEALSFYTNNAASEAMFTDSTIYENMNRLVKLLGYNPNGYNNPNVELLFSNTDPNGFIDISSLPIQFVLPKYTSFKTDKTDNRGQSVYYSLVNVFFLERNGNFIASDEKVKTINGKWKVYVTPLKSTGIPFESFELSDLTLDNSDINTVNYISHPYVDVYIKRIVNNTIAYLPFKAVSEGTLFNDSNTIYGPTSNVFELRINERKKYNLTFGDGLHGSRLQNNDELVVVYLEGNGSGSELSTNILNITGNNILVLSVDGLLPSEVAKLLQVDESDFTQFNDIVKSQIKITNPTASTTFTSMESVDDIRKNAPSWFRMGQNLITAKDYEQYIKGKYREDIYD